MRKLFTTTLTLAEAVPVVRVSLTRLYLIARSNRIPARKVYGIWELDAPAARAYGRDLTKRRQRLARRYGRRQRG